MPKLKSLSGKEVVKIFLNLGFELASKKGSHVKLRRILEDGTKQILTIPYHNELDKGTIRAIFRQSCRYIPEPELKKHFYSE